MMTEAERQAVVAAVQQALAEDIGPGDVTSEWTVEPGRQATGRFLVKEAGVIAGLEVATEVFRQVDPAVRLQWQIADGAHVPAGQIIGQVQGSAISLLSAERTALNFLQRMSATATLAQRYVQAVQGTRAVILDTRKTVPGLRLLDKMAVRLGGAQNHRIGLYDMVLIKDNHIAAAGGITAAVKRVRAHNTAGLAVEVEVTNLQQLAEALPLGVDRIMLDNMDLPTMRQAVEMTAGRCKLEASGGVNLDTVARIAATGVDFISVGALTHSIKALDVSLDLDV